MWAWAIGSFSLAAVVNQIAIALWWRALAAPNPIFTAKASPALKASPAPGCVNNGQCP
ncbi:MAG: hypothetical protein QOC63_3903 [Mycobacterium sp.]|jgi:hypothetical protein|nr:hypothetical protein [Mycobacterium sp.]